MIDVGMEKRIIEFVHLHPKCEFNRLASGCGVKKEDISAFFRLVSSLKWFGILEIDKTDGTHMEVDFSKEVV